MTWHAICFLLLLVARLRGSALVVDTITAGTVDVVSKGLGSPTQQVSFSISGKDFSLTGSGTQMNPDYSCSSGPSGLNFPVTYCPPGSSLTFGVGNVLSYWGPITGTFTFQGSSDKYAPPFPTDFVLSVEAQLDLTVPTNLQNSVTMSGPFWGPVDYRDPNFQSETHFLFYGTGIFTANLILESSPETGYYYFLQSVHLDYATPVPEPRTPALTGAALACLSLSCLARRPKQRAIPGLEQGPE